VNVDVDCSEWLVGSVYKVGGAREAACRSS
jgi:hypothetical protein